LTSQDRIRCRFQQYAFLFVSIIATAILSLLQPKKCKRTREPYHKSILTGEGWVLELMGGHPERIRCELGVYRPVFSELIIELRRLGHSNSKYVSLEEQLAVFLYTCVTGLTVSAIE
jgi:hypothetical protein